MKPSFGNSLTSHPAVLPTWTHHLGPDLPNTKPFLRPIQEKATSYPCTDPNPCGCHHEIVHTAPDRIIAFCTCDEKSGCEKIQLTESDLIQYQLDLPKLGKAISQALGLEPMPIERSGVIPKLWRLGRYRHTLVYFTPDDLTAPMATFITTEPCLVLVPTDREAPGQIRELRQRLGSALLPLDVVLQLSGPGQLQALPSASAALEAALPKPPPSVTKLLADINTEIKTIRTEHVELRASKARLAEMQSKGLFEFTQKVDPKSFKILCTVLAEGNVLKASETLKIPNSTLRKTMDQWPKRGPAYQVMLDLVRWRKTIGRKEKIAFNPDLFHEKQESIDYPGLLSDVLDGLLSMTDTNWEDQCAELADLLRSHTRH